MRFRDDGVWGGKVIIFEKGKGSKNHVGGEISISYILYIYIYMYDFK